MVPAGCVRPSRSDFCRLAMRDLQLTSCQHTRILPLTHTHRQRQTALSAQLTAPLAHPFLALLQLGLLLFFLLLLLPPSVLRRRLHSFLRLLQVCQRHPLRAEKDGRGQHLGFLNLKRTWNLAGEGGDCRLWYLGGAAGLACMAGASFPLSFRLLVTHRRQVGPE